MKGTTPQTTNLKLHTLTLHIKDIFDVKIELCDFGQWLVLQVLVAQDSIGHRNTPVNAKRFVLDVDTAIGLRMVELVALVLEDGDIGQDRKTVRETAWDEELAMIIFGQFDGDVLAESGTALADIDRNIKHAPLHATHQLRLRVGHTLIVQAAHHAVGRHRLVVLNEVDFVANERRDLLVKFALREGLEKIAARIVEDTRFNDQYAWNGSFYNVHCCLICFVLMRIR